MRMKEICEKTGLTDRAVRLYIDSGLLSPERSTNYSGYTSIHFSETDLEKLEMIAMLRRAGFGISDIREMQDDPSCISEKIQSRCSDIERSMKEQSKILSVLTLSDASKADSIGKLAAMLKEPTGNRAIPKEDNDMKKKDFIRALHTRIWTFLMFPFLILGIWFSASLCIRAVFADMTLQSGGVVSLTYRGPENGADIIFGILPPLLLIISAVMAVIHFLSGKRKYLITAMGGIVLSAAMLICMPARLTDKIRLLAFTDYRHSFLFDIFGSTNGNAASTVWLLMLFGAIVISFFFCLIALFRSFGEPKDSQI